MVRLVFRPYTQIPPEFPLASAYSSVVHHLSGRTKPALALALPRRVWVGRSCIVIRCLHSISLRDRVFAPYHSHDWYTPWSVFQDGPVGDAVLTESPAGFLSLGPWHRFLRAGFRTYCPESSCSFTPAARVHSVFCRRKSRCPPLSFYRPAGFQQHRRQVATLQPLPTQRFQVF